MRPITLASPPISTTKTNTTNGDNASPTVASSTRSSPNTSIHEKIRRTRQAREEYANRRKWDIDSTPSDEITLSTTTIDTTPINTTTTSATQSPVSPMHDKIRRTRQAREQYQGRRWNVPSPSISSNNSNQKEVTTNPPVTSTPTVSQKTSPTIQNTSIHEKIRRTRRARDEYKGRKWNTVDSSSGSSKDENTVSTASTSTEASSPEHTPSTDRSLKYSTRVSGSYTSYRESSPQRNNDTKMKSNNKNNNNNFSTSSRNFSYKQKHESPVLQPPSQEEQQQQQQQQSTPQQGETLGQRRARLLKNQQRFQHDEGGQKSATYGSSYETTTPSKIGPPVHSVTPNSAPPLIRKTTTTTSSSTSQFGSPFLKTTPKATSATLPIQTVRARIHERIHAAKAPNETKTFTKTNQSSNNTSTTEQRSVPSWVKKSTDTDKASSIGIGKGTTNYPSDEFRTQRDSPLPNKFSPSLQRVSKFSNSPQLCGTNTPFKSPQTNNKPPVPVVQQQKSVSPWMAKREEVLKSSQPQTTNEPTRTIGVPSEHKDPINRDGERFIRKSFSGADIETSPALSVANLKASFAARGETEQNANDNEDEEEILSSVPSWMTESKFPTRSPAKPIVLERKEVGGIEEDESIPQCPSWMTASKFPSKSPSDILRKEIISKEIDDAVIPPSWMTESRFPSKSPSRTIANNVNSSKTIRPSRSVQNAEDQQRRQSPLIKSPAATIDSVDANKVTPKMKNSRPQHKDQTNIEDAYPVNEMHMINQYTSRSPDNVKAQDPPPAIVQNGRVTDSTEKYRDSVYSNSENPVGTINDNVIDSQETTKSIWRHMGSSVTKQIDNTNEGGEGKDEDESMQVHSVSLPKSLTEMAADSLTAVDLSGAMYSIPSENPSFDTDASSITSITSGVGSATPAVLPKEIQDLMDKYNLDERGKPKSFVDKVPYEREFQRKEEDAKVSQRQAFPTPDDEEDELMTANVLSSKPQNKWKSTAVPMLCPPRKDTQPYNPTPTQQPVVSSDVSGSKGPQSVLDRISDPSYGDVYISPTNNSREMAARIDCSEERTGKEMDIDRYSSPTLENSIPAVDNSLVGKKIPLIDGSEAGSSIVFGDPDTFGSAAGSEGESPHVLDRAKAIEEWRRRGRTDKQPSSTTDTGETLGSFPTTSQQDDPDGQYMGYGGSDNNNKTAGDDIEVLSHRIHSARRSILRDQTPKSTESGKSVRFSDKPPPRLLYEGDDNNSREAIEDNNRDVDDCWDSSKFDAISSVFPDDIAQGRQPEAVADFMKYWATSDDSANFVDADQWVDQDPDLAEFRDDDSSFGGSDILNNNKNKSSPARKAFGASGGGNTVSSSSLSNNVASSWTETQADFQDSYDNAFDPFGSGSNDDFPTFDGNDDDPFVIVQQPSSSIANNNNRNAGRPVEEKREKPPSPTNNNAASASSSLTRLVPHRSSKATNSKNKSSRFGTTIESHRRLVDPRRKARTRAEKMVNDYDNNNNDDVIWHEPVGSSEI